MFFALAFGVRAVVIFVTPAMDGWIDTLMYMNSADLMRHGVNPYDYGDAPAVREALRLDSIAYDAWTSESQERWNYYAAGNLPMSLVLYRVIAAVSFSRVGFRIGFALLDSLLAGVIALYVLRFWGGRWTNVTIAAALGLGAFSPILLKWGTLWNEDKGLQVVLMLAAIYTAHSKSRAVSFYFSALLAGAAIAFKLFGAFIVPSCLKHAVYDRPYTTNARRNLDAWIYLVVAGVGVAIWFVAFLPAAVDIIIARFLAPQTATSLGHASPWLVVAAIAPGAWDTIRVVTITVLVMLVGVGYFRGRLTVETTAGSLMVLFACLVLTAGSMDRMNMALTTAIVIAGPNLRHWTPRILAVFWIGGLVSFAHGAAVAVYPWHRWLWGGLRRWDTARETLSRVPWQNVQLSDIALASALILVFFVAVAARVFTAQRAEGVTMTSYVVTR